jgi:hypothetical protein
MDVGLSVSVNCFLPGKSSLSITEYFSEVFHEERPIRFICGSNYKYFRWLFFIRAP